jgi:hypothetical protein
LDADLAVIKEPARPEICPLDRAGKSTLNRLKLTPETRIESAK